MGSWGRRCFYGVMIWLALGAAASAAQDVHSALKMRSLEQPRLSSRLLAPTGGVAVESTHRRAISRNAAGKVLVTVTLDGAGTADELATLQAQGLTVALANLRSGQVEGWVLPGQLGGLTALSFVRFVAPTARVYPRATTGSVVSEGYSVLRADRLGALGITGAGVKVGVISDGVSGLASSQLSGDSPAVNVLANPCMARSPGDCAEGTAMIEIVHDMAPGASIGFCGAVTMNQMQSCVSQLANTFKADVIVDDLGSPTESTFEEDSLAATIAAVVNTTGVLYVSAAGNGHGCFYEADYNAQASAASGAYDSFHDFGLAAGQVSNTSDGFVVPAGGEVDVALQWNDPYNHPVNDYDLFLEQGSMILASSTDIQGGFGGAPALEILSYINNSNGPQSVRVLVARKSGAQARHFKLSFSDGSSSCDQLRPLAYHTDSGDIWGHPASLSAIAVGAIDANDPSDPQRNSIDYYSGQGPVRLDFPTLQLRHKPDISGVDDVSISGAGGFVFRGYCPGNCFAGTSAAAPHIAGILALLKGSFSGDYRQALSASAINVGAVDIFGAGRADAFAAAALLNQAPVATITAPTAAVGVGQPVNFSATCADSEGPGGKAYHWSFGADSGIADSSVQNPTALTFTKLGSYNVSFSCMDAFGANSNTATRTVTVVAATASNTDSGGGKGGGAVDGLLLLVLAGLMRRR